MTLRLGATNPAMARIVETQMRNWELSRAQRSMVESPARTAVQPFVTISRSVGSGGAEVGALLAERLGWPIFDKEILRAMAGDDRLREQVYGSMDERDMGWFEEAVRAFSDPSFAKNDYFRRLTETVLSLARQGSGVYLGRGLHRVLPAGPGLRVRLAAPRERCVARVAAREGLSIDDARSGVDRLEQERAEFVRKHFQVEADDASTFDLIVILDRFSATDALELILHAMKLRGIID